jgi:hypothetical protein
MQRTAHPYAVAPLKQIRELWNTSFYHDPAEGSFEKFLADAGLSSMQVPEHCPLDHQDFLRGLELANKLRSCLLRSCQLPEPPAKEKEVAKNRKRVRSHPTEMNNTETQEPKKIKSELQAFKRHYEMYASKDFKGTVDWPATLTYLKGGVQRRARQQLPVFWRYFFLQSVVGMAPPSHECDPK